MNGPTDPTRTEVPAPAAWGPRQQIHTLEQAGYDVDYYPFSNHFAVTRLDGTAPAAAELAAWLASRRLSLPPAGPAAPSPAGG
jgi:hypothetical protein